MSALPSGCRERLLARLRSRPGQDPFRELVTGSDTRPEQLPGYQVGLYAAELDLLRRACERFRPADGPQAGEIELPSSGVVVTLGVRGAGKTTLLHRLRAELPDALIVRPTHYRPDLPFPQYILHEFVFELNRRSQHPDGDIVARMADRLAGKVVYELLGGLSDVEWVRECGTWPTASRSTRWLKKALGLWGFFTRRWVERRHKLRQGIADHGYAVRPLLQRYPNYADDLQRLALDHVHQREGTTDLEGAIRAGLYRRLVQLAFAPHTALPVEKAREELVSYLVEGYTREYSGGVVHAPQLAVAALLRCLVGLLALHRIPPVVAFDAFDTIRMFGKGL